MMALILAVASLKEQQTEIERLKSMNQSKLDTIHDLQAEIERLTKENKILSKNADTAFQDGLNEAQTLYAEQVEGEMSVKAVKEYISKVKYHKQRIFSSDWSGECQDDAVRLEVLDSVFNSLYPKHSDKKQMLLNKKKDG